MLNKAYQLITALYAGGYRFLAVFLVDAWVAEDVAIDFARYFLWTGLLGSVVGVPIAARAQVRGHSLSRRQQLLLTLGFLGVSAALASIFWVDSGYSLMVTLGAGLVLSLFEIARTERATAGHFVLLTVCACTSLGLLLVIVNTSVFSAEWLNAAIFAGLALPVLSSYIFRPHPSAATLSTIESAKRVGANAVSSILGTTLTFVVPLVLIEEFGSDSSVIIAQVFAIATLSFSYPRYLATGFIHLAKQGRANFATVARLSWRVAVFGVVSCGLFAVGAYFFEYKMLTFYLLFVAMQLSQLSLPYANWWTSLGREINVMQINFIALLILAAGVTLIFLTQPLGEARGQLILMAFVGYNVLRFVMYSQAKFLRVSNP